MRADVLFLREDEDQVSNAGKGALPGGLEMMKEQKGNKGSKVGKRRRKREGRKRLDESRAVVERAIDNLVVKLSKSC
jgi:hypothetical protein